VTEGSNSYAVTAVYTGGQVGDSVANVYMPTCSGYWVLVSQNDQGLVVNEHITEGACTDVELTLTRNPDGTLHYAFNDTGAGNGESTLRRD
jgi:hypothetical protein